MLPFKHFFTSESQLFNHFPVIKEYMNQTHIPYSEQ